ncbi:hypothetical protein RB653_001708 [Dictyostelium firmibasis]|uniref:Uncharacterized protein n=1 Tax=Dictyostelium firmibasis TaxID=79012 RepID=A0AAN7YVL2_9MYCE
MSSNLSLYLKWFFFTSPPHSTKKSNKRFKSFL